MYQILKGALITIQSLLNQYAILDSLALWDAVLWWLRV